MKSAPQAEDEALVAHYEALRVEALGMGLARGHGLALILRRGMAAWMSAWPREEVRIYSSPATTAGAVEDVVTCESRREAIQLLVGMALAQRGDRTA